MKDPCPPGPHLQTPSQTIGPFYAVGLAGLQQGNALGLAVSAEISGEGEPITLSGRIFDGAGEAVDDAMIEILQADSSGRFDNEEFLGLARSETGASDDGSFLFRTVKPGATSPQAAPCISVIVHMRGLLRQAHTRLYFSDEAEANSRDPVFSRLPVERRDSLIARRESGSDAANYRFDIHMQGEHETLFFEL